MTNAKEGPRESFIDPGKRFCPADGNELMRESKEAGGMCGSIIYYTCSRCGRKWREDQRGIVGRSINLTDMSGPGLKPPIPSFL